MLLLILVELLQFCLFTIVRASPMKEVTSQYKETGENRQSLRYSPYTVKPASFVVASYHCQNGQIIPQVALINSAMMLCPQIESLRESDVALTLVSSNSAFRAFRYPIQSNGDLLQQTKDARIEYMIEVHQDLRQPLKCSFSAVYSHSDKGFQFCHLVKETKNTVEPHSHSQLQFQPQSNPPTTRMPPEFLDCNGKLFHPSFFIKTLRYAQEALQKKLTKLQLSLNEQEGYPIQFIQPPFDVTDIWMFPLLADGVSVYTHGDPGPYFIIMRSNGPIAWAVYRKDTIQIMKEAAARMSTKNFIHTSEFMTCSVKKEIASS